MMNTPICDFVRSYSSSAPLRLHMPGHKGFGAMGFEELDITEIQGADSLFHADGIIAQSEANTGTIFGCHSFYSTEGSSLCIRAMLYLCIIYARSCGKEPLIAAARNVHTSFITAAALLDFPIQWLYSNDASTYLSCKITPAQLEQELLASNEKPIAFYVTSPDYLGNTADIQGLAQVCHQYGMLLIVDNAHGSYLKFLPESQHPMDLGADLCCDSAHKTLAVLTGGAYLHIHHSTPPLLYQQARRALSLFASTSPSYLILQSLDAANLKLYSNYRDTLSQFISDTLIYRDILSQCGYHFVGEEPLKWTIDCKSYGYYGYEIAQFLHTKGIETEFSDPDYLVMMLSPENSSNGLKRLTIVLSSIPPRKPILSPAPYLFKRKPVLSIREAMMSNSTLIPIENSLDYILASPSVGCPPAVPIIICGERIDQNAIECFQYYRIEKCCVIPK